MKNKRYLITGGTGSFGKTMLRSLLDDGVGEIVILSRDEEKQDSLRNELRDDRVLYRIGDIRDRSSVEEAMRGVDHVFHAAALKQVPSCEFFPMQAVMTNIVGSENVLKCAISEQVKSVVCLSTDKAVFPVNAMGMSKAMMEKLAQAASRELGADSKTVISSVRYGNVMFSRGSVIPLFMKQVRENKSITLTVPEMTRFLMPLRDSVDLVKFAFEHAEQGDLFIRKAAASSMDNILKAVLKILEKPEHPVEIIGWRHGEKLYETLASSQELTNSVDLGDYYRLLSDNRNLDYKTYFTEGNEAVVEHEDFHSHNAKQLSVEEVVELLMSLPEVSKIAANF